MPQECLDHADFNTFFDKERRGRAPKPVRGQVGFDVEAFRQPPQPLSEGGSAVSASHRVEEQPRCNGEPCSERS